MERSPSRGRRRECPRGRAPLFRPRCGTAQVTLVLVLQLRGLQKNPDAVLRALKHEFPAMGIKITPNVRRPPTAAPAFFFFVHCRFLPRWGPPPLRSALLG